MRHDELMPAGTVRCCRVGAVHPVVPFMTGERPKPSRSNIAPSVEEEPVKLSVLICPLSVYNCPLTTLSEFIAIGAALLQAAVSLNSKLAAPSGAGVVGSRPKQAAGNVHPAVPCEKSPFNRRLELNDPPTAGAVKPPSTSA